MLHVRSLLATTSSYAAQQWPLAQASMPALQLMVRCCDSACLTVLVQACSLLQVCRPQVIQRCHYPAVAMSSVTADVLL